MSIATEIYNEAMSRNYPSNALSDLCWLAPREQNWEKGETMYIFEDGSKIIDAGDQGLKVLD